MTCPVCRQPIAPRAGEGQDFTPFCSERCRSVDLFRWTEGKYAIVEDIADRPDVLAQLLDEMENQPEEAEGGSWDSGDDDQADDE